MNYGRQKIESKIKELQDQLKDIQATDSGNYRTKVKELMLWRRRQTRLKKERRNLDET